jgi:hypothetical protein
VPARKNTTVTIREATRRRLAAYKRGDSTFDDLLNRLMDKVDVEDVMAEDVAEHYRLLNDPEGEWVDGLQVAAWLRGQRKDFPPVVRKGPRRNVPRRDAKQRAKAA